MGAALDAPTRALVRLALELPQATERQLGEGLRAAAAARVPARWIEELLLSSVLYVGYPRALVAMAAWRREAQGVRAAPGATGEHYGRWRRWKTRGEKTCRIVYGKHYGPLREYVRGLHPALEAWMMMEGYGRTLSRPGLELWRRELCAVGMILPQRAPRQLVAHLRGALNGGATPAQVDAVLDLAGSESVPAGARAAARELWRELRATGTRG